MKFLGSVLVAAAAGVAVVYFSAMVVDSMESQRFWHQVEPSTAD